MSASQSGAALLEVIVAVAILAVAGVSAVTAVTESAAAVRRAREVDAEVRAASAFMEAVSLWTRDDLDLRLGERSQGAWNLTIERPLPTLYTITLSDGTTGLVLLSTSLYRPEVPVDTP